MAECPPPDTFSGYFELPYRFAASVLLLFWRAIEAVLVLAWLASRLAAVAGWLSALGREGSE